MLTESEEGGVSFVKIARTSDSVPEVKSMEKVKFGHGIENIYDIGNSVVKLLSLSHGITFSF